MQQYELNYIVSGDIPESDLESKTKEVAKVVESCGGKVVEENIVGRKPLSYPIKNQTSGVYIQLFFDIDPEKSPKVVSELKSYPFIIRHFLSSAIPSKPKVVLKPKPVKKEKVPTVAKVEEETSPSAKATGDRKDQPKVAKKTKPVEDKKEKLAVKKVRQKPQPKTGPPRAKKAKLEAEKPTKEQEIIKDIEGEEKRLKKLDEKIEELLKE